MTYMPTGREAVMIDGPALSALLAEIADAADPPYMLRLSYSDGKARWKINQGMWSPPYDQDPDPNRTH